MSFTKKLTLSLFVLITLGSVAGLQYLSDRHAPDFEFLPPYVLSAKVIRMANLGLDSAAASYMWLSAIQDFSASPVDGYGSIYDYINTVNFLDPKFAYPYAFGALVLPGLKLVDEGLEIGKRGVEALPEDWQIPYYTGSVFHDHLDDRISAMKMFDIVAKLPSTPPNIRSVAINYGTSSKKRTQTREFWKSIAEESNDEIVLERARLYLEYFDLLDLLDLATSRYKSIYRKNPSTLDDLVSGKILKYIPANPFGLTFRYDLDGQLHAN